MYTMESFAINICMLIKRWTLSRGEYRRYISVHWESCLSHFAPAIQTYKNIGAVLSFSSTLN